MESMKPTPPRPEFPSESNPGTVKKTNPKISYDKTEAKILLTSEDFWILPLTSFKFVPDQNPHTPVLGKRNAPSSTSNRPIKHMRGYSTSTIASDSTLSNNPTRTNCPAAPCELTDLARNPMDISDQSERIERLMTSCSSKNDEMMPLEEHHEQHLKVHLERDWLFDVATQVEVVTLEKPCLESVRYTKDNFTVSNVHPTSNEFMAQRIGRNHSATLSLEMGQYEMETASVRDIAKSLDTIGDTTDENVVRVKGEPLDSEVHTGGVQLNQEISQELHQPEKCPLVESELSRPVLGSLALNFSSGLNSDLSIYALLIST